LNHLFVPLLYPYNILKIIIIGKDKELTQESQIIYGGII